MGRDDEWLWLDPDGPTRLGCMFQRFPGQDSIETAINSALIPGGFAVLLVAFIALPLVTAP